MHQIRLLKPTKNLKNEYLDFYLEWKESGENMVPWVIGKDPEDFEGMISWLSDNENGKNLPDGWVSDSTFWLVSKENRVLGVVNIRHKLTEFLSSRGGHIGYGIRPSERRKGYATKLLELSLEQAKKIGINNVLVVCDEINHASEKTIINNGGVPDSNFIEENGNVIKRYWIHI